jgi:L-serine dehydratase
MNVSVFDLFKPGVGPSSSHTMGPMTAAGRFLATLGEALPRVQRVEVRLYASLAFTGRGHGTDSAVILGLAGYAPTTFPPDEAYASLAKIRATGQLPLAGRFVVPFAEDQDLLWRGRERLPQHPNALSFTAFGTSGQRLGQNTYFSVGGGFVQDEAEISAKTPGSPPTSACDQQTFGNGAQLLAQCALTGLTIAEVMRENERRFRSDAEINSGLDAIVEAMEACIERGISQTGELPGGLKVKRRASQVHQLILSKAERQVIDPLAALDWVNLWALAVNEENAAGGRVVTAPTNGAAGIVPAVLRYYDRFHDGDAAGRRTFLLTAAAIGALYKRNASISGAEVGCQGEVGVACSMAAAGLAAVLGGNAAQVENAAEIGMEHNLGLTCDPIGGLVQIPCIERNAMGATKAIDAARLALLGDGQHSVSLDKVIATMNRTGRDMSEIYKETSLGGLAVNLPEC